MTSNVQGLGVMSVLVMAWDECVFGVEGDPCRINLSLPQQEGDACSAPKSAGSRGI